MLFYILVYILQNALSLLLLQEKYANLIISTNHLFKRISERVSLKLLTVNLLILFLYYFNIINIIFMFCLVLLIFIMTKTA